MRAATNRHTRRLASAALGGLWVVSLSAAPADGVSLEVGSAVGSPGGRTSFTVVLHSEGSEVVGVQVDVGFEARAPIAYTERGKPECVDLCPDFAPPRSGGPKKSCSIFGSFALLPLGCEPAVDCGGVRLLHVALDNVDPLPDGAYIFQCFVDVSADSTFGTAPLQCANPGAADPNGMALPTTCTAGAIHVVCPADCNGDEQVLVNELVTGIRVAQGSVPLAMCAAADANGNEVVDIAELVKGRISLLQGCARPPTSPTPSPTPAPGFAPPVRLSGGYRVWQVAAADLNGDGAPDIVATNPSALRLAVLLGRGDGTFAPAQHVYPVASEPVDIVIADLDGDGAPDLVATNVNASSVTVVFGHGDGTFAAPRRYTVDANPWTARVADLNRDTIPDLVTFNGAYDTISVLLGHGDGSFAGEQRLPGCQGVLAAVADFTADGIPDVVTPHAGGFCLLGGTGEGGLSAPRLFGSGLPNKSGLVAADLDGDGRPDLAASLPDAERIAVLRATGSGAFANAVFHLVGANPANLVTADVDGDGLPDLITANSGSDDVSLVLGSGGASFHSERRISVGRFTRPRSIAVADFDGNGRVDIVTANGNSGDLSLLLAQP